MERSGECGRIKCNTASDGFHALPLSPATVHRRGNSAALAGGDTGSGGSIPSSATGNSDETNSVDEHSMMMAAMNNNNNLDNGMSEICDVPDHVANQKRHVSILLLHRMHAVQVGVCSHNSR